MDHTLNGGDSNLQPSLCTKRWSYMNHKLLKADAIAKIAYKCMIYIRINNYKINKILGLLSII